TSGGGSKGYTRGDGYGGYGSSKGFGGSGGSGISGGSGESHILDELVEYFSLILEYLDSQLGSSWQWEIQSAGSNRQQRITISQVNYDQIEGEMDKLAMEEAGFRNCTEAVNLDTSFLGLQVLLGDMPHAWNFHLQLLFKEDQDEKDSYVFS
ncbi:hypothetical protein Tco_0427671, partial [Tanacetum coccineum]